MINKGARIYICSGLIPEEVEKKVYTSSLAAGKYLRNMSKAFEAQGFEVHNACFCALPDIGNYLEKYVSSLSMKDREKEQYTKKDYLIIPSVLSYQKKLLMDVREGDIVIFYNINYSQWGLACRLKKRNVKCVLILADYSTPSDYLNPIRKLMALVDSHEFRAFDHAVILSDRANQCLSSSCKYFVVEGGLDVKSFEEISIPTNNDVIDIFYAGTLSAATGVDLLLDSISNIKNDKIRLRISGKGPLKSKVEEAVALDSRISFLGYISEKEYIDNLNKADIVINPRNMSRTENQYNFPSKVLEYLASGRIVVSTRFPGWERFTNNFIFYDSTEELPGIIDRIRNSPELADMYYFKNRERAKQFSWSEQTKRIIELVSQ